jgi:hypothetical protein
VANLAGWKDRTRAIRSWGGIAKGVRNEAVLLTFKS